MGEACPDPPKTGGLVALTPKLNPLTVLFALKLKPVKLVPLLPPKLNAGAELKGVGFEAEIPPKPIFADVLLASVLVVKDESTGRLVASPVENIEGELLIVGKFKENTD